MVDNIRQHAYRILPKNEGFSSTNGSNGKGVDIANGISVRTEYPGSHMVTALRVVAASIGVLVVCKSTLCDRGLEHMYRICLNSRFFQSVYFETIFATLCYAIIIPICPWLVDKLRCMDKFKINPSVKYESVSVTKIVRDALFYTIPLMLLDTFMVKKYEGVGIDPVIWHAKRQSAIQTTRALPESAPSTFDLIWQLVASIIVYDAIFFLIHLLLQKIRVLYKYVHKHHHDHGMLHAHVTNQLSVVERITLVLSANFSLKIFYSHPLTRTVFIPVFIWMLVENHSGYDMPFSLHRLLPFGLAGGPVKHFEHHVNGQRCYQPFFTYLDTLLNHISRINLKMR
ncbi:cholesterol 25-hydroxylase-like protein isoform X2 [Dreissena polymorpha]|uniref:cholesterol 25-hydroxylase-like protein isoform X2 n=1 Tax=Dreissena polymorpha TaxID=45954 RepID=UPI0022651CD1|nr:cholesterol 25-hydroxylase-like protein isoform X2 [Dreissena polymorpha]